MTLDQLMSTSTVMAIFRNHEPAQAVAMAAKAWDLGIDLVEVPVQVPSALATLEAVVRAGAERGKSVGAGTVTTIDQLRDVHARSVAFTVAPGLDAAVVAESATMGLPHLPGVSTPTEIQMAARLGSAWVKAFPASVLGTEWFKAMQGPFPNVSFVATGGIDADNANDFFSAGARMVAVGSALTDARQVELLAQLLSKGHRLRATET
jgi:2-dehydro-3-deoxyphosphogluconate aldolase/(4S)-4-hydroxy-2-oxoglutarate aldolase